MKVTQLLAAKSRVDAEHKIKFKVPTFQPGLVWSEERRRALIELLRAGLPFGSILLASQGIEDA